MKDKIKGAIIGALAAATVCSIPVMARNSSEGITAVYRNIKLVIDGIAVEPKDANGNIVEPFIYNGTTYLPVRAVAEALHKEVSWDGDNAIVTLGTLVDKPAIEMAMYDMSYTENTYPKGITGLKDGANGYIRYDTRDVSYEEISNSRYLCKNSVTYPLNGLAKSISGEFYMNKAREDFGVESILKIYNSNDKLIYESPIMRNNTKAEKFDVNVENELSVRLEFYHTTQHKSTYDNGLLYIKNPTIITSDY